MKPRRLVSLGLIGLVFAAMWIATGARANPVCTFTVSDINFGSVDLTSNTVYTATGTVTATCTELNVAQTVSACPSIGSGSGGAGSSGNVRYLANGGNQLQYNLYQDAGMTQVWGSMYWAFPPHPPDWTFPKPGNTVVVTKTVYARIPAGQTTLPTGSYSSSFAGVDARNEYKQGVETCDTMHNSANGTVDAPFVVSANNMSSCIVTASTLNFGNVGVIAAAVDAVSTISVTCDNGTPYTVALNGGLSGATNPTLRKMTLAGANVTYGIYRNAARTQAWGSTVGVNTAAGTGTGTVQSLSVYGRVPAQTTPAPGTYSDTIVVTIAY